MHSFLKIWLTIVWYYSLNKAKITGEDWIKRLNSKILFNLFKDLLLI